MLEAWFKDLGIRGAPGLACTDLFRACPVGLTQSQYAGPQQQANLMVVVSAPWGAVHIIATKMVERTVEHLAY